jgi:hypothetical protein
VTDQDLIDPPDNMTVNFTAGFTTFITPIPIHDIQGASHFSPKNGQTVQFFLSTREMQNDATCFCNAKMLREN